MDLAFYFPPHSKTPPQTQAPFIYPFVTTTTPRNKSTHIYYTSPASPQASRTNQLHAHKMEKPQKNREMCIRSPSGNTTSTSNLNVTNTAAATVGSRIDQILADLGVPAMELPLPAWGPEENSWPSGCHCVDMRALGTRCLVPCSKPPHPRCTSRGAGVVEPTAAAAAVATGKHQLSRTTKDAPTATNSPRPSTGTSTSTDSDSETATSTKSSAT